MLQVPRNIGHFLLHLLLPVSLSLALLSCAMFDSNPPTVAITSPSSITLDTGNTTTIKIDASDGEASIAQVQISNEKGEVVATITQQPFELPLTFTAKDNGTHVYTIKVQDANGNWSEPKTVTVTVNLDNIPPTVSLASSETSISSAGSVTLTANASDASGISKVEFFEGNTLLGTDNAAPFEQTLNFTSANNGAHNYTAKATDKLGNTSQSNALTVTVNLDITAPNVSLNGSATSISKNGAATLTALANDNVGLSKVEFFDGTTLLGTDETEPFEQTINFTDANNGTHNYTAKATDSSGNAATSTPFVIAVDIDNTAPTVSLSSNHDFVTRHGTVKLNAAATDNKGIGKIELFEGDSSTPSQTLNNAPFEFTIKYTDSTDTKHSYTVKAHDPSGNTSSSNTVVVNTNSTAPLILPLLVDNTVVKRNGNIKLSVDATDTTGVTEVQFYEGNTQLGSQTTPTSGNTFTFPIQYNDSQDTKHTYTARALNAANNISSSDPTSVQTDSTTPTVALTPASANLTGQGPKNIVVIANAQDANGIAKIEFFKNGTPISADEGNPLQVSVSFNESQNGTYIYTAKTTDKAGNVSELSAASTVAVDLDNTAPVVSGFTSSTDMTNCEGSVKFTVQATDNKGISKVELLETNYGPRAFAKQENGEFTTVVGFADETSTTHTYTVKAFDAADNTSSSQPLIVKTDCTPPATPSVASNKTMVKRNGTVNFTTTLTDQDLDVVELLESDGSTVTMALQNDSGLYLGIVNFEDNVDSQHSFVVRAKDKVGNSSTSEPLTIFTDSTAPSIGSVSSNKNLVKRDGTVKLSAQTNDANGIAKVELIEGNNPALTMTSGTNGYEATVTFNDTTDSAHSFVVTVTDKAGNSTTSEPVVVNTDSTAPNAPSLTSDKTNVTAPDGVTLTASVAADAVSVEFFQDGTSIGMSTTNPFTKTVSLTTAGTYTFTAKASDALGNTSVSSAGVSVTVTQASMKLKQVSVGYYHSFALDTSNNVWAWGWNNSGQVGDGTNGDKYTPTKINFTGLTAGAIITSLKGGDNYSLALDSSGNVWAWGDNQYGQLGNGTNGNRNTPTKINTFPAGTTITSLSVGRLHAFALDSSGNVWAWGYNGSRQLGDGTTGNKNTPTKINTFFPAGTTITSIIAGGNHAFALDSSGNVWAWGYNGNGQLGDGTTVDKNTPTKINSFPVGTTITSLAAGDSHVLALDSSNNVWGWGGNWVGQLGDGTTVNKLMPTKLTFSGLPAGTTITSITSDTYHALALDSSNNVWAWGYNDNGQVGDGTTVNKNTPTKLTFSGLPVGTTITNLSGGLFHSLALDSNGNVWAWGRNNQGQVGDGTGVAKTTPTKILVP